MNYKLRTSRAFTLIELVVAIAILVMVISFAGVIFKVSINTYRIATASTEIMQKLRAITNQINADFKGVRRTVPGKVRHHLISGLIRSDCIAFLANGDFQSTEQYVGRTVVGNVASIFYGHSATPDPNTADPKEKILLRRQTILTYDANPSLNLLSSPIGEYYKTSLAEWRVQNPFPNTDAWVSKPPLDVNNPGDLVMYMAKGVDDFAVQFAMWDPNSVPMNYRWWPMNYEIGAGLGFQPLQPIASNAIKFTFTLYDSKGVIKNGRKFTHIVYLGN